MQYFQNTSFVSFSVLDCPIKQYDFVVHKLLAHFLWRKSFIHFTYSILVEPVVLAALSKACEWEEEAATADGHNAGLGSDK